MWPRSSISAAARTGTSLAAGVATVATVGYAGFLSGPPLIGGIASFAGLRVAIGCLVLAAGAVALLGLSAVQPRGGPSRSTLAHHGSARRRRT